MALTAMPLAPWVVIEPPVNVAVPPLAVRPML